MAVSHWYAALAKITKASYSLPLRALKMRNHPYVPMRPMYFPHLACLLDGSLIPSCDLVRNSTGRALASAGSLPLSHLINNAAGCTLFDNDRQRAQTVFAALTQDSPYDIVFTRLHELTRPPAHARVSAVRSAPDDSISVSDPPDLSDSASDSALDSDTAPFHSVSSDPEMSGYTTDAPDSVCSNPELISGSAHTTAVVVTNSDLHSFLRSGICQCTARHRCSCQVGRDAGLLSVGFALVLLGRQQRLCCSLFNAISTAGLLPEHSMF